MVRILFVMLSICAMALRVSASTLKITFYEDASCSSEGNAPTATNPFTCSVGDCCAFQGQYNHLRITDSSCTADSVHYLYYYGMDGCGGNAQSAWKPLNKCINRGGGAGGEIFECID